MPKPSTSKAPHPRAAAVRDTSLRVDWLLVLVAATGAVVSGYLGWVKLAGGHALLCTQGGGCDIVQASRYATILGVPTALWGTGYYLAVAVLAVLGFPARQWLWMFLLAVAGFAFSVYLTVVSLFVLAAACPYCLASMAIAAALLGIVLWRRRAIRGQGVRLRWSRVLTLAGVTAVATIVIAAAIFASYPGGAPAYQTALARYLARTNAVMYGAFW